MTGLYREIKRRQLRACKRVSGAVRSRVFAISQTARLRFLTRTRLLKRAGTTSHLRDSLEKTWAQCAVERSFVMKAAILYVRTTGQEV